MSTETKQVGHTPGPWRVDESFAIPHVIANAYPKNARCVAVVYGDGELMAHLPHDADDQRECANARLIAAAPDLLQGFRVARLHFKRMAMKYHHSLHDNGNEFQNCGEEECKANTRLLEAFDTQIAKAEGR